MPFAIKLGRPVTPDRIPSFESCMSAARTIMNDTPTWKPGKVFNNGTCRTYSKKPSSGPDWHLRVTRHSPEDGTFQEFWNVLGVNHSEHETKYVKTVRSTRLRYIPEISKATCLQILDAGVMEVWSIHYALSPPFSPRTFSVLIITHLEAVSPRQGWVISIPYDTRSDEALMALEERGIRGRYAAVERLREMDDGTVEWRVATTTTIGGMVPDWITSRSVPGAIAEDVVQFLAYLKQRRDKKQGGGSGIAGPSGTAAAEPVTAEVENAPGAASSPAELT